MKLKNEIRLGGGNSGQSARNSSIELLRIIAMFAILAHHFVVHNIFDYTTLSAGALRFFLQLFLESGGKIAVVIFFTTSAWYFLERPQSVGASFKRVWVLEKELLFYSVTLGLLVALVGANTFGIKALLKCFMPLTQQIWWYPTAYVLFLFLLPFLVRGLGALGREWHLRLCLLLLLLYGLISLIPGTQMVDGVYSFIYLFVLIAAYRWYLEGKRDFNAWLLILLGMAVIAAAVLCSMALWDAVGMQVGVRYGNFLTDRLRLPVVMVGIGLFLLFQKKEFHSRVVNKLASGAFAVYLITEHPAVRDLLWTGPFDLGSLLLNPFGLLIAFGLLAVLYLGCTLFDLIRQALFKVTVDRVWGRLYKIVYGLAERMGACVLGRFEE